MNHLDVEAYLRRIGLSGRPSVDLAGLTSLMDAHLRTVPFENLSVYFQRGVDVDPEHAAAKIVERRRGGWCFELNGAFALLLRELGFEVLVLGAAVLLDGPNRTVDHMTLEVNLDQRYLVDVGFGESAIVPLDLNQRGDMDGGNGRYRFMPSAEGTTLVRVIDKGDGSEDRLEPQFRFRRVGLSFEDFRPASDRLYHDSDSHFRSAPVVTRLLDRGADRVTLTADEIKLTTNGRKRTMPLTAAGSWARALDQWFYMDATGL